MSCETLFECQGIWDSGTQCDSGTHSWFETTNMMCAASGEAGVEKYNFSFGVAREGLQYQSPLFSKRTLYRQSCKTRAKDWLEDFCKAGSFFVTPKNDIERERRAMLKWVNELNQWINKWSKNIFSLTLMTQMWLCQARHHVYSNLIKSNTYDSEAEVAAGLLEASRNNQGIVG